LESPIPAGFHGAPVPQDEKIRPTNLAIWEALVRPLKAPGFLSFHVTSSWFVHCLWLMKSILSTSRVGWAWSNIMEQITWQVWFLKLLFTSYFTVSIFNNLFFLSWEERVNCLLYKLTTSDMDFTLMLQATGEFDVCLLTWISHWCSRPHESLIPEFCGRERIYFRNWCVLVVLVVGQEATLLHNPTVVIELYGWIIFCILWFTFVSYWRTILWCWCMIYPTFAGACFSHFEM
jgi:hypothetical protein